jgi:hypothetical protein
MAKGRSESVNALRCRNQRGAIKYLQYERLRLTLNPIGQTRIATVARTRPNGNQEADVELIQKVFQERRGQGIHLEVGAEKPVMGTIKEVTPEYLILLTAVSNERYVLINQIRWFEFTALRKSGDAPGA